MKILISAYSCETNRGSEPGIGWNWILYHAQLGHEVHALIYPIDKDNIESYLSDNDLKNINIIYLNTPKIIEPFYSRKSKSIYIHYFIWQILAFFKTKQVLKQIPIDYIQHVTMGSFRIPSFLGFCGKPFVFGPLGGGEQASLGLIMALPFKFQIKEYMRIISNILTIWNPLLLLTFYSCDLILCRTSETKALVPKFFQKKTKVFSEIHIKNEFAKKHPIKELVESYPNRRINILFAGRLVYWKGIHLAIKTLSELKKEKLDVSLTIIGSGSEEAWLKKIAIANELENDIEWIGWLKQEDLHNAFSAFDLFLFPSLHDASGQVVLESICYQLPVVCLDLGGPKEIVEDYYGVIVTTKGLTEKQVVKKLSQTIKYIMADPNVYMTYINNCKTVNTDTSWINACSKCINEASKIV